MSPELRRRLRRHLEDTLRSYDRMIAMALELGLPAPPNLVRFRDEAREVLDLLTSEPPVPAPK